jgi:hypothetical protein
MQTTNKGGDVLARGGSRCQFAPMGGNVSQQKWDEMWSSEDSNTAAVDSPKETTPSEKETVKN